MHKIALIALALFATTLLGFAPLVGDESKERLPEQPETKDLPPEDRDWAGYVFDADSTAGMNKRLAEAQKLLKSRMQGLIDQLATDLDDEGDRLLMRSQSDWKQYALSNSAFDADAYRGGTLAGPTGGMSYTDKLCKRIKELNQAIEARKPR